MERVAVILAGSGSRDGSEIHESTLALLALSRRCIAYDIFAPDIAQAEVVDHLSGELIAVPRNCMIESARIARGRITPLAELKAENYDALIVPGGFGTAKNLFSYAFDGLEFKVLPDFERVVSEFHAQLKPIGAMCIAPLSFARIFEGTGALLTLGPDSELSESASSRFDVRIRPADRREAVVDWTNRIVSVPCYMYDDAMVADIEACAEAMVIEMLAL